MSEFKFACPVCGQHITADSDAAGSQLECPTCFRKIVVPEGRSSDPKFVIAASEANKPRPQSTPVPSDHPAAPSPKYAVPVSMVLLVILICAAGTTLFVVRGKIFRSSASNGDDAAPAVPAVVENPPPVVPPAPEAPAPPPSLWTLDLTNATFPSNTVYGNIRGQPFTCERAILQGAALTLRHGPAYGQADLAVNITFFVDQPARLAGHRILMTTNNTGAPRVILRWKDGQQMVSETFTAGYAMKLELGALSPGGLPGRIFLCLPDASNSWVAGVFNAEIRKPPQPKAPKPPKRRS
jgi:DNA-directed RNA polymerase subunit RPC12/RpoP